VSDKRRAAANLDNVAIVRDRRFASIFTDDDDVVVRISEDFERCVRDPFSSYGEQHARLKALDTESAARRRCLCDEATCDERFHVRCAW